MVANAENCKTLYCQFELVDSKSSNDIKLGKVGSEDIANTNCVAMQNLHDNICALSYHILQIPKLTYGRYRARQRKRAMV